MADTSFGVAYLRDADQKIALCKIRVAVWSDRLEKLKLEAQPMEEAETHLSRLQKTQRLYERHRRQLLEGERA